MRATTLLPTAVFAALALSGAAAAEDIPSLRDRPVLVECYQNGTKILAGEASDFEPGTVSSHALDFLLAGRALQIREVGTAVCVIHAKEPAAGN